MGLEEAILDKKITWRRYWRVNSNCRQDVIAGAAPYAVPSKRVLVLRKFVELSQKFVATRASRRASPTPRDDPGPAAAAPSATVWRRPMSARTKWAARFHLNGHFYGCLRCDIAKFHYTDTDTDFFAAKLRWVRAGPFGSMSVSVSVSGPCPCPCSTRCCFNVRSKADNQVSLIYRTEPKTKKVENIKTKK